ncbi:MAG: hypothetical protein HY225_02925 [Candidatus Vogelbacteria bacterium]|nr:hypothetical protein [Candidatus Vogelbacteria bacterium]
MISRASWVNPTMILAVLYIGTIGITVAVELFCSVCYARAPKKQDEILVRIITNLTPR